MKYLQAIGSDSYATFFNIVKELLETDWVTDVLQSQVCIWFSRTAHILVSMPVTWKIWLTRKKVQVINNGSQKLQHIFAAYKFYGTFRSLFNSLRVHIGTVQQVGVIKYKLRFAKMLGIFEIRFATMKWSDSDVCNANFKNNCAICDRIIAWNTLLVIIKTS